MCVHTVLRKEVIILMKSYSAAQLQGKLRIASDNMALFYQADFINYRGRTSDTDEFYTEIIAEWLLEHFNLLEQIPTIRRNSSYRIESHDGIPDTPDSNREEELLAMAMFSQKTLPIVGRILDYQTPLKSKRTDKAGKIDILSYDGECVRVLELKKPESEETMLRCVLEGYTYMKTADLAKLLLDFDLSADTAVRACPFVVIDGAQHQEIKEGRPQLQRLMDKLNITPLYYVEDNQKFDVVEG